MARWDGIISSLPPLCGTPLLLTLRRLAETGWETPTVGMAGTAAR